MTNPAEAGSVLPELPDPWVPMVHPIHPAFYTADQMRAYAIEALTLHRGGAVACFRIVGKRGPWGWVDGPPPDDANEVLTEGERIELAYTQPPAVEGDKDGERYRWLRGPESSIDAIFTELPNYGGYTLISGEDLDAAIDSAIAASPSGRG